MSDLDLRVAYTVRLNGKGKGSIEYLTPKENPMSASNLILKLSGELLIDPALLVETIKEEEDLRRVMRSYSAGDFTYADVLDTVKDYF